MARSAGVRVESFPDVRSCEHPVLRHRPPESSYHVLRGQAVQSRLKRRGIVHSGGGKQVVEDAKEGCCDQALTISESGKDATTIPRNGNPRIDLALPPNSASNAGPRQGWPWPSPREGMLETLQHRNRLTSYGVGFRSFTEAYLDSCGLFKDAVIAILAVIAKPERIRLSEGTKAGLAAARRKGKVLGRRRAVVEVARVASLRSQGLTLRAI